MGESLNVFGYLLAIIGTIVGTFINNIGFRLIFALIVLVGIVLSNEKPKKEEKK